ncbi:MAG: hypothetical protein AB7I27_02880 [Bacteriovoracaceae bacterium]
MRKYFSSILIITSLLYGGVSYADFGGMDSGGGQGYVCFDSAEVAASVRKNQGNIEDRYINNITSLESLDLFEARMKRGSLTPILYENILNEDLQTYLANNISRIGKYLPSFANRIIQSQQSFREENIIWAQIGLVPVNDSHVVASYDTSLCTLTTLAIQFKEEALDFLNIDPRLFYHSKMTVQSQAILLLHEYIYLVARNQGKTSSRSTRLAISYLIRDDKKLSVLEVAQNLFKLGMLSQSEFNEVMASTPVNLMWGE